jgi:hypothetical protein
MLAPFKNKRHALLIVRPRHLLRRRDYPLAAKAAMLI